MSRSVLLKVALISFIVVIKFSILTAVVIVFNFLNVISTHLMTEPNAWFRLSWRINLKVKAKCQKKKTIVYTRGVQKRPTSEILT